ncbi:hypothetical protein DFQ26_004046 [Actinomortierella ambigua]|nr:hypothetical protein DFQ26_004046 [Actinomortierella ambigua]
MAVIKEAKVVTAHTIRHGGRPTHLKEALFNTTLFKTVKKAIAASGKKRKAKNNSVNGSNDKDSDTVGEEKDQEGDYSADEKYEPGTTGDHNDFCTSLLRYHRRPTATLRTGKRFIRLIQSARGH